MAEVEKESVGTNQVTYFPEKIYHPLLSSQSSLDPGYIGEATK